MSVDYYCELATEMPVDEVAGRLHASIGGTVETEGALTLVLAAAMTARVWVIPDARTRQWALEDWGISPRIRMSFQLDRSMAEGDYLAARRDFSIATVRLAEGLDTDAILRIEMNRLMMRRKDGILTLYDWWPDWTDPVTIAALPAGYVLTSDGGEASESTAPDSTS